jgi:ABC-type sugar transport system ATPase subunit
MTCLYLTRRLNDAVQTGDRVTIVRDGKAVATYEREGYDEAEMGRVMLSQRLGDIEHIDADEKGDGVGGLTGLWRGMFSPKR